MASIDHAASKRHVRRLAGWVIGLASALAVASVVSQQMQNPLNTAQQTVVSGTTSVVVVLIPGFPIESVLIGCSLGFFVLYAFRRRRASESGKRAST